MNSQAPIGGPRFWRSLFTDEASFAHGQFNFWATAETTLANCGFWYVALHWETLWPLYSSLFVAPFLFLRSDASVTRGADWFLNGYSPPRWPDDPKERAAAERGLQFLWSLVGSAIGWCVAFVAFIPAAYYFLVGHEGWPEFFRGFAFSFSMFSVAVAITAATAAAVAGLNEIRVVGCGAVSITGVSVIAGMAMVATVAGAGAVAAIAGMLVALGLVAGAISGAGEGENVIFLPGWALGIWLHALFTRIIATAYHFDDGYRSMPANIRRLAFFIAPLHPPEIIPGLPERHELRFEQFFAWGKTKLAPAKWSFKIIGFFALLLMLPIWFAPGWLYRIILKSTLWLWWILFFVGGAPNVARGVEGLEADYKKIWVRLSLIFAAIGLGLFLLGNLFHPFVANQLSNAPLLPILAVFLLIDWRSIPFLPLLDALSSILTLGAWLWADSIMQDSKVAGRKDKVARGLGRLAHLTQWKTAIGVLTIALLMLYVALLANAKLGLWEISDWFFNGLSWLYGENAAALH